MNIDPGISLYHSLFLSAITLLLLAVSGPLRKRYSSAWIYRIFLLLALFWALPLRPRIELPFPLVHGKSAAFSPAWSAILTDFSQNLPAPAAAELSGTPMEQTKLSYPAIFFFCWAGGIVVVCTCYILRHLRFTRFVRRWSLPVSDHQVLQLFESVKNDCGIKSPLNLKLCKGISTPMLTGLLHPAILLPEDPYTETQLSHILRHECIHYRQKDLYAKLLVLAATAVHWFNPVVWLMSRTISLQCEMACDERALQGLDLEMRKEYGKMILNVIGSQNKCRPVLSTHFYGGKKEIKIRIHSIMAAGRRKSSCLLLCLLLTAFVLSSCTTVSEPEVLSGYIVLEDNILHFDEVEIIRPEDIERVAQLGLEEQRDMPDGFCIYNESDEIITLELTDKTVYHFTDMELYFVSDEDGNRWYSTADKDEFLRHLGHLNEYPLSEQTIPYFLEVKDGKVISITEKFEFTI